MNVLKNKLFWIFVLALSLRLFRLGEFPVGFHVDEAKVGWNALSILKTGSDDQLNKFPLYYNSFGDFRPTGIFYLTIPSILLFGTTIFATRFASALFGALSIFAIYKLTNALTKSKQIAFMAAFFLSISSWHIAVSRATSEVVISVFFAISALYFLIKLFESQKNKYLFLTTISILLSYLSYHSIRVLAPMFYTLVLFYYHSKIRKLSIFALLAIITLSLYFTSSSEGLKRLSQVSIGSSVDLNYQIKRTQSENLTSNLFTKIYDNKYSITARFFVRNYLNYFSPDFLIGESARPYRYTTPGSGLVNIVEVGLLIAGLLEILRRKKGTILIVLLLVSPLPAALTIEDSPNLQRALFMIPFISIVCAYGFYSLVKFRYIIYLLLIPSILFQFHMYFNHSISHKPFLKDMHVDSPTYRNSGTIELVKRTTELKSNYDKVILPSFPDSPYPWFAYFGNIDPKIFNLTYNKNSKTRIYENLIFSEDKCPTDDSLSKHTDKHILMIDNWECGYESQIKAGLKVRVVDKIYRPDGSEVFIFLEKI